MYISSLRSSGSAHYDPKSNRCPVYAGDARRLTNEGEATTEHSLPTYQCVSCEVCVCVNTRPLRRHPAPAPTVVTAAAAPVLTL